MKTLKLKKDVVEQLTSNEALNLKGGGGIVFSKNCETAKSFCVGCPILPYTADTVCNCLQTDLKGNCASMMTACKPGTEY